VVRAKVDFTSTQILGTDLLDRVLATEGLVEVPIIEVPVDRIDTNPYQTRQEFDEAGLQELATSMREHGFYGHLVARQVGDRYQIAYGERRLRAAERAELPQLPLAVRELTDEQMMELAVTENVLRKDLNPIEEAEAYQHLANLGRGIRQISRRVGKSPAHISMLLSLLKKEDVAQSVRHGRVGIREAHEIAKLEEAAQRQDLLNRAARGELNREAVKEAVKLIQEQQAESGKGTEVDSQTDVEAGPDETTTQAEAIRHVSKKYNPLPNLRAALKRFEKIRADRFTDIEVHTRADVRALLDEITSRAQYLLEQLEQDSDESTV
jgi:ParB family chromosome partitioning protein